MFDFLKRLMGAGREPEPAAELEYEGFTVVATPHQVSGGWSTEGVIKRTLDGEDKEVPFIRADTTMSREDAIQVIFRKARKIIDERGERVFDKPRA